MKDTKVELCCSPVGEEHRVDFLVPTVLLQSGSVASDSFLILFLLKKLIAFIFQAVDLLCRGERKKC